MLLFAAAVSSAQPAQLPGGYVGHASYGALPGPAVCVCIGHVYWALMTQSIHAIRTYTTCKGAVAQTPASLSVLHT